MIDTLKEKNPNTDCVYLSNLDKTKQEQVFGFALRCKITSEKFPSVIVSHTLQMWRVEIRLRKAAQCSFNPFDVLQWVPAHAGSQSRSFCRLQKQEGEKKKNKKKEEERRRKKRRMKKKKRGGRRRKEKGKKSRKRRKRKEEEEKRGRKSKKEKRKKKEEEEEEKERKRREKEKRKNKKKEKEKEEIRKSRKEKEEIKKKKKSSSSLYLFVTCTHYSRVKWFSLYIVD